MEVVERIKDQIDSNPVLLYMKGTPKLPMCGFSSRASQALQQCGVNFAYVNILQDQEIRATLPQVANWPTFPQLYVGGELVGGSDIIAELHEQGELQKMVTAAAENAETDPES